MSDALKQLMATARSRVDATFERWLPEPTLEPVRLHQAMRYATLGGGKRVRPVLVYATGAALGVAESALDGPAAAIEMVHAYSLVHDDLPAMDNDDLRRGRPTCHIEFDEATALLAGDALQTLAFDILARDEQITVGPAARLAMVAALAQACGSRGMAGGQGIDLAAVGQRLDLARLENMHIHKTGALIRSCTRLASLSCDAIDPDLERDLDHYAKCIGLAFQIHDDVLDVEADTATLGKPQGSDAALNKPTYPSLIGLAESKRRATELCNEAIDSLSRLDGAADPLRELAIYIVRRGH